MYVREALLQTDIKNECMWRNFRHCDWFFKGESKWQQQANN